MKYIELNAEQTLEVERKLENAKIEVTRIEHSIVIGQTLAELKKDPKYIQVFDEYFLKDEVIRDTMLLTEKYFLEENQRMSLQDSLVSKAHFNDWVKATTSMATLSASRLAELHLNIKELETVLTVGYAIPEEDVTPPEGVPNV